MSEGVARLFEIVDLHADVQVVKHATDVVGRAGPLCWKTRKLW